VDGESRAIINWGLKRKITGGSSRNIEGGANIIGRKKVRRYSGLLVPGHMKGQKE